MAGRQSSCDRRKDVAAVEGVADGLSQEVLVGDVPRRPICFAFADPTKQSIVRANKELVCTFDNDRTAIRANARINYCDVNRPFRKIVITTQQSESGRFDVLWWNFVVDIDDRHFRSD